MADDETPVPVEMCCEPGCCNPVRPPTCRMYAAEFDAEVWHLWTDFGEWEHNLALTPRGMAYNPYPEEFEVIVEAVEEVAEVTVALGEKVVTYDDDGLRYTGVVVGLKLNWSGDAAIIAVGVPDVCVHDAMDWV